MNGIPNRTSAPAKELSIVSAKKPSTPQTVTELSSTQNIMHAVITDSLTPNILILK